MYEISTETISFAKQCRRHIHQNPELSMQEYQTTAFIAEQLKKLGISVTTWEGETGLIGVIEGDLLGKTIALRADIDALPLQEESTLPFKSNVDNVAHCCGHDIHSSVLLGTARELSIHKNKLPGRILLIFQCAEETLGGSKIMIDRGILESYSPEFILGLHCWPEIESGKIGLKKGPFMASSDGVDIVIKGKQGHAAHPHKNIDPMPAAGAVITSLQTIISRELAPVDSAVISITQISGGKARNIIADAITMSGTIRCADNKIRNKINGQIDRIVTNIAAAYRCEGKSVVTKGVGAVINDDKVVDLLQAAGNEAIGEENIVFLDNISLGSEDFSRYMEYCPGAMFRLGTGNDIAESRLPLHNPSIMFDEKAIETGIKVLSNAVFTVLNAING